MMGFLARLSIDHLGVDCNDGEELDRERRRWMLRLLSALGIVTLILLGFLALFRTDWPLVFFDCILFIVLIVLFGLSFRDRGIQVLINGAVVFYGIFMVILLAYGGQSHATHMWPIFFPVISLSMLGARKGSIFALAILFLQGMVFALGRSFDFITEYSLSFMLSYVSVYLAIFLLSSILENLREKVQFRLREAHEKQKRLVSELQEKISEVQTLQGILPICAKCKKVRNDQGYWLQVEKYIQAYSDARLSHGLCPDCARELYPEFHDK